MIHQKQNAMMEEYKRKSLVKDLSLLEGYFFNQGYDAYLNQDFEDIVLTVYLLDNDTVALDSYNNGLRRAYKDNNIGNHIGK